jgi:N4-gp56 family major capsid protein
MAQNYASMFSPKVDELFHKESQVSMALNHDYKFTGVKTVEVYSIPTAPLNDYKREGTNRYGDPANLGTETQSLTINQDKSWTFIIDKGDKLQSQMVLDAGKALSRQMREVIIPFYDTYVFDKLARAAIANGNTNATAATKSNAYELFLNAQEALGDKCAPEKGRICFCSYKYANLLKQDTAFMKYGNLSQEMVIKGVMGEVDGTKIVKVPKSRLPEGCSFILTHPIAATAPKQLDEYKIHENAPGVSGWLVEGRMIFDAFVLNNKADAIWYQGTAIAD